jgi:limonene-1,2-epoxide hydrolase
MTANHEKTLRSFIGEWGENFDLTISAFREYLAPDAVWEQHPLPTTRSVDEAIALLRDFRQRTDLATFPADIRWIVVSGDVAFAERVDHLRRSDGSLIASVPVTGVFEFNSGGKISAWREYFDSALVMKTLDEAARNKR